MRCSRHGGSRLVAVHKPDESVKGWRSSGLLVLWAGHCSRGGGNCDWCLVGDTWPLVGTVILRRDQRSSLIWRQCQVSLS